jgi:GAF domain-containing protein
MLNKIRGWFRTPDDESPGFRSLMRSILIIALVANIVILILVLILGNQVNFTTVAILVGLLVLVSNSLFFLSRGNLIPAKLLLPLSLVVAVTFIAFGANSVHDTSIIGFALAIVIGGLLLGEHGILLIAGVAVLGIIFLGLADMNGLTTTLMASKTGFDDITIISVLLIACAGLLRLLLNRANNIVRRSLENEQAQIIANQELKELQTSLEQRVEIRTRELQETSAQLEKRAGELEAVSNISRSIALIQDIDALLSAVVNLITEWFGFYHTGIFILNDTGEYVVLRAASSVGGQRMVERKHNLKVEPTSLVGFAASRGLPRISLEVTGDAFFLSNPDLPETRSEMALPLLIGKQVIGVLDVQSTEENAFDEQDVNILGTLANQVAISIQNARSFSETRRALAEAEKVYQQFVEQGWRRIASETAVLGYVYTANGLSSIGTSPTTPEPPASPKGRGVSQAAGMAVPVKLRGQVIGILNVRPNTGEQDELDPDEIALIQAAAERAALALENARLLEDSQRRAAKERTIGEISTRISTATNIDTILQTAVEEIGHALGGSEVTIKFNAKQPGKQ